MAVSIEKYMQLHNKRKLKRQHMIMLIIAIALVALIAVSWILKLIGFSLTDSNPFSINTTVNRLDVPNPDTNLIGSDFYRQYFNITGNQEVAPIDLLIVVDQSNSMATNKDFHYGDSEEYRDVILSSLLNGEANADYRDNFELDQNIIDSIANDGGFVNQFLSMNPENKIAIIGLNTTSEVLPSEYTSYDNAQVVLDWTSTPLSDEGVDVTGQYGSGTDFAAGIMLADEMLNSEKVADDGHKKVLIIISDGEPTCYTDADKNVVEYTLSEEELTDVIDEDIIEEDIIVEETAAEVIQETEVITVEETTAVESEIVETEAILETEEISEETIATEEETEVVESAEVDRVIETTEETEVAATETELVESDAVEEIVVEEEIVSVTQEPVFDARPSVDMDVFQSSCNEATLNAFNVLLENNEDLVAYSIGLSEELKPTSIAGNEDKYIISQLISETGSYLYVENDADELRKCVFDIVEVDVPNNVVLTAELSNYVEILPVGLSDIKVTMADGNGTTVVLYDERNGGLTSEGSAVIENIIIAAPSMDDVGSNGTVNLIFKPEYVLVNGTTYTLSFNVALTDDAYDSYFMNGYDNVGDKNTDYYPELQMSSGQNGFYINKIAYISYAINGETVGYDSSENVFGRPVVQIEDKYTAAAMSSMDYDMQASMIPMPMALANGSSDSGNVDFTKTIDNLGDPNPDTDLSGNEYYRLYLDIEGLKSETKSVPVDLLIIVDQSGSMFDNADVTYNGNTGLYRDVVISTILNGQADLPGGTRNKPEGTSQFQNNYDSTYKIASTVTNKSLINQFLAINPENKVAVIGFDAWRDPKKDSTRVYDAYAADGYSYLSDTRHILDWTSTPISGSGVDVTGRFNTGTDYDASFRLAYDMFTDPSVATDGHEKVLIFISDGVPTCYIDGNGDRAGSTFSTVDGNPATDNIVNVCRKPSLDAYQNLITRLNNEGISIDGYSVGISSELNPNNPDTHAYSNYVIRQCIANKGIYVFAESGDDLDQQLHHIINAKFPSQVVITDKLSQYVEFYSTNPDVKVVMTDDKGNTSILYDSNQGGVTSAGTGIIDSVTYAPAAVKDGTTTGTITATFNPAYALKENYTYSLSYNVKVTDVAYNEFATGGYSNTGNSGTDYPSNNTSSNNLGFNSNKEATVDYFLECKKEEGIYQHPVVQVEKDEILTNVTVEKQWEDANGPISPVEPVTVQLYQIATPVQGSGSSDVSNLYPGSTYTAQVYEPLIYEDFNDDSWANRVSANNISSLIEFVDTDNNGDMEVHVKNGRGENHYSFYFDLNDYRGQSVKVDARMMAASGNAYVTFTYRLNGSTEYVNYERNEYYPEFLRLENCSTEFKEKSVIINVPANATNCRLYIETGDKNEFWVDYFIVSKAEPITYTYTTPHDTVNAGNVIFENFTDGSSIYGKRGNPTLTKSYEAANQANGVWVVSNRRNNNGLQDWIGVECNADKFIGQTIYAEARAMSTGSNGEEVELGIQYQVPNNSGGYDTIYDSLLQIPGSNGKYTTASTGMSGVQIPDNATNCRIFAQTTQGKNTAPDFYLDYIYVWSGIQIPTDPTTIPYRDLIVLSTSNENTYMYEDLPLWGLSSSGYRVDYTYYVVEDVTGKPYQVTYSNNQNTPVNSGTITVTNTLDGVYGYELPKTGGVGTGFNYLTGLILMCIPGGFYIKRIRKKSVRDP